MTNLERVRDFAALFLDETGVRVRAHEVLDIIDSHVKKDAERESNWSMMANRATYIEAELAELREAVRRARIVGYKPGYVMVDSGSWDAIKRQLIEEKP